MPFIAIAPRQNAEDLITQWQPTPCLHQITLKVPSHTFLTALIDGVDRLADSHRAA
jgi:hypothetical protein